jgi:CsoR family transcriptional regulator, copper-sensing transcriptional repressor
MTLSAEKKADLLKRLARAEGQVRGIQRMISEDTYCGDVLNQIASTQEALRGAAGLLLRNHLNTCVADTVRAGDGTEVQESLDEVMKLVKRLR